MQQKCMNEGVKKPEIVQNGNCTEMSQMADIVKQLTLTIEDIIPKLNKVKLKKSI